MTPENITQNTLDGYHKTMQLQAKEIQRLKVKAKELDQLVTVGIVVILILVGCLIYAW